MKKLFALVIGILTIAACSREVNNPQPQKDNEVVFTTNIQTFTFKSATLDGQARILAGAPINANEVATPSGDKLIAANKIYWKENQTEKTSFGAVFPAEHNAEPLEYDLVFDGVQSYAYHNTVLVATAKDVTPGDPVVFNFKHPFSNIVIKVTNNLSNATAISKVEVQNAFSKGQISILSGTSAGTVKGSITATAKEGQDNTWQVLVFPGSAKPTINITTGEKTYSFILASEVLFEANKSYTAEIEIKDSSVPGPAGVEASFGFDVDDWVSDAPLVFNPSDSEEPNINAGKWSIIGKLNGDDWTNDIWMEEVSSGIWEASITYADGDEFKIRQDGMWSTSTETHAEAGTPDPAGAFVFVDGTVYDLWGAGSGNIKLPNAGNYVVRFLPDGYHLFILPEITELYILGDATPVPWSIADMPKMTANAGVFTWTGALNTGGIRFLPQQIPDGWFPAIAQETSSGKAVYITASKWNEGLYNHFAIPSAGNYSITVNAKNPFEITCNIE